MHTRRAVKICQLLGVWTAVFWRWNSGFRLRDFCRSIERKCMTWSLWANFGRFFKFVEFVEIRCSTAMIVFWSVICFLESLNDTSFIKAACACVCMSAAYGFDVDELQYTWCLKKVAPLKLFGIFSLLFGLFVWKFANFGNSYPHISANFCRFICIFHKTALIFSRLPIVFSLSSFDFWVFTHKMKMQCTSFSEMTSFFRHRVSVSDHTLAR